MRGSLAARVGAAVACMVVIGGCGKGNSTPAGSGRHSAVSIRITPSVALIDRPVRISIAGLRANANVTLRATWHSYDGVPWRSSQRIHADAGGRVTLHGLDGMSFIWSMKRANSQRSFFGPPIGKPNRIALEVDGSGAVLGRATLTRLTSASSIRQRELTVAKDGLYGYYFAPNAVKGRRPALLLLSGSGGGAPYDMAAVLASRGYPALALNYFAAPGLPPKLSRIPLEYFARGLRWLKRQPHVDPQRLVVEGGSRGGEAAMLIGSEFPDLAHGVIGLVPGAVTWGSSEGGDAWTFRGKGIPPQRTIRVEQINGPILMAGSGDDHVWSSSNNTDQIELRLTEHHFRFPHTRLDFPKAGHDLDLPYKPQADPLTFGGDRRATAAAQVVLWKHVLDYLNRLSGT